LYKLIWLSSSLQFHLSATTIMRFTKAVVDALIAKVAPQTMADCFYEPSDATVAQALQYFDVSNADLARIPILTHPGSPHFVYVDLSGVFQSCFFTGIYSVKDKDKSNITYFGGVHIGQDFSLTPVIFELARAIGAILGVASSATALKLGMVHTETSYMDTVHFPENSKTHVQQFAEYGFTEIDLADPLSLPVGVAIPKILLTSSGYAFPDRVKSGVKSIC
jgi:hypothetical protein